MNQEESEFATWETTEPEPETPEEIYLKEEIDPQPGRRSFFWTALLILLLLTSLGLNAYVLYTFDQARQGAATIVTNARANLYTMSTEPVITVVEINQRVPISETIEISQTFAVPVDIVYPLDTVVNTSIRIPLLGPQEISVPIQANIPVQFDYEVPIRMAVPISMTYNIEMEVPVEVMIPPQLLDPIDQILLEAEEALK